MDEQIDKQAREPKNNSKSLMLAGLFVVAALIVYGLYATGKKPTFEESLPRSAENAPQKGSTETTTSPKESTNNVKEFNVTGNNFSFDVTEMRVKKGDTVRINFFNKEGFHDWVIDEFNSKTNSIKTGESETIEFVANKTGTFEYYCSVGLHRAMGMKGNLIVE